MESSTGPQNASNFGRRAGTALLAVSLLSLLAFALRNWTAIAAVEIHRPALLAVAALIYGISHLTTALSWPMILRGMGEQVEVRAAIRIGLVAQIGKYLPGNIAHYVGRAVIARDAGVRLVDSGISTGVEILAAVLAAVVIGCTALFVDPRPIAFLPNQIRHLASSVTSLSIVLLLVLGAVAAIILRQGYRIRVLLDPITCLSVSFALAGVSFFTVVSAMTSYADLASIIGVFVLGWTAGFLMPGSPAGLGIREAILIAFLSPMIGTGTAIVCAILHRLITALVDATAALAGYASLILSKKKKSAKDVLSESRVSSG